MSEPVYTHDCDRCTYLETRENPGGVAFDWYRCDHEGEPVIVARYGNAGPDNWFWVTPLSTLRTLGGSLARTSRLVLNKHKAWD